MCVCVSKRKNRILRRCIHFHSDIVFTAVQLTIGKGWPGAQRLEATQASVDGRRENGLSGYSVCIWEDERKLQGWMEMVAGEQGGGNVALNCILKRDLNNKLYVKLIYHHLGRKIF